ncbi:MAG: Gfo/Idh/MocA family oxidoreductase [Planctomycetota bacterium]|nr:Gfo/Idh/MocA family oxidoreductase [Planctomycetota bacterium]
MIGTMLLEVSGAPVEERYRVGIIGHTGRGDYGHGLHTMWTGVDNAKVVSVADADPNGLNKTQKIFKHARGFTDFRELLTATKPDVLSIGMRHVDQHHEVALKAIEAGVRGIYIEKPFCRSSQEADDILSAASARNVKIAVAHRNRYHPVLPVVKQLIVDGVIGRVLEYRMRGKEDTRGGMLDLWVLGGHLVNLVNYFAGSPKSCSAIVLISGRPATRLDPIQGAEGVGLIAGNEVHARFEMEDGITAYFDSIANAGNAAAGFGVQIIGTEGIIDLRIDREPLAHVLHGSPFHPVNKTKSWIPISTAGIGRPEPIPKLEEQISKHILGGNDLLNAIEENREPLCNAKEAATTIEMLTAVSVSHLENGARIALPLQVRTNPWIQ